MRFKLLAAIALLSIGSACSSGSLTDETLVSARRVGLRSDKVKADLLICSPAERVVVVKQIGPEGGVIHAGGHKFHIPNGSLAAPVTITMEVLPVSAVVVDFSPAGLRFNAAGRPPQLTMDLNSCPVPPGGGLDVVFITENLDVLERLPSDWDPKTKSLKADIRHFSRYAVAF